MNNKIICYHYLLLTILFILLRSSVANRPKSHYFAPHIPETTELDRVEELREVDKKPEMEVYNKEKRTQRGLSRIGSRPPNCGHKCSGCVPCNAIQVPAAASKFHNRPQIHYANYEPEGWKCKCGSVLFNP